MFSAIGRLLGLLLGAALTVLIVGDMVWPANPLTGRIKGQAFVLLWDRQSPLVCGGNAVMVLRGTAIDLQKGTIFEAGGRCQLSLLGVRVRAPRVLSAGGDARVVIEGGRLEATDAVLDLGGSAVVAVRDAVLLGPIRQGGTARVEGLAHDPRVRPQVAEKDVASAEKTAARVCGGLLDCYKKAGEYGQIGGEVVVELSSTGEVRDATYGGSATKEVQACLLSAARARRQEDHRLGAGRVRCEWAGAFLRSSQALTMGARFEPAKDAPKEKVVEGAPKPGKKRKKPKRPAP